MDEHNIQKLLVAWFRKAYPLLAPLLFAIPNGGHRDPVTARRLKDEGVLPGIPDLFLAFPTAGSSGLFIEMKTLRGTATKAQKAVHAALQAQGYSVAVARGYDAGKKVISEYLSATML